jgi:hypothetical protein
MQFRVEGEQIKNDEYKEKKKRDKEKKYVWEKKKYMSL